MKTKDVKILWGRSGNRCAFPGCKIELTPDGATSTLGEMAHIVADSPNGPRGESTLTPDERDQYSNLILLCPTHHTQIDSNPEEWTVERLVRIKAEHENWVSRQLEQERIFINKIDNLNFLDDREKEWTDFATDRVWSILSLTPLNIEEDIINPLDRCFISSINSVNLLDFPEKISNNRSINCHNTKPSEYGLINENLRDEIYGMGHQIQIFRNGHVEFLVCLDRAIQEDTNYGRSSKNLPHPSAKVFRYSDIAECFSRQIFALKAIWDQGLPFNDMLVTAILTNTNFASMYSGRTTWHGYEFGSLVKSNKLKYTRVCNKYEDGTILVQHFVKRFVNYFGLDIDTVFSESGSFNLPKNLS